MGGSALAKLEGDIVAKDMTNKYQQTQQTSLNSRSQDQEIIEIYHSKKKQESLELELGFYNGHNLE